MKLIASYILYKIGDFLSFFLRFNCLSWIYNPYSSIMLYSAKLDVNGKIWNYINDCDLKGEQGKECPKGVHDDFKILDKKLQSINKRNGMKVKVEMVVEDIPITGKK